VLRKRRHIVHFLLNSLNELRIHVGGPSPDGNMSRERQFDSSGKKSRGFTKGGSISTKFEV